MSIGMNVGGVTAELLKGKGEDKGGDLAKDESQRDLPQEAAARGQGEDNENIRERREKRNVVWNNNVVSRPRSGKKGVCLYSAIFINLLYS